MICKNCGKTAVDGVANCIYCGYVFSAEELSKGDDDKTIALYDDELTDNTSKDKKITSIAIGIIFCAIVTVCIIIAIAAGTSSPNRNSPSASSASASVGYNKENPDLKNTDIGKILLSDSWLNLTECFNKRNVYTYFTFYENGNVTIQKQYDEADDEVYHGTITSCTDTNVNVDTDCYGDIQINIIDNSDLLELSYDNGYGVLVCETVVLSDYEMDSNNVQEKLKNTYWQSGFINQAYPESIIHFYEPSERLMLSGNLITENENIAMEGFSYSSEIAVIELEGYIIILELTDDDKKINAFIEQFDGDVNSSKEIVHAKEQWTRQNI